jgi:hypothetical protein
MSDLLDVLERHVGEGRAPGAVALVARVDRVEVAAVGSLDASGGRPFARDTLAPRVGMRDVWRSAARGWAPTAGHTLGRPKK